MTRVVDIPVDMRGWLRVEIDDAGKGLAVSATGLEVRLETIEHDALMGAGIAVDDDDGAYVPSSTCADAIEALQSDCRNFDLVEIEWVA